MMRATVERGRNGRLHTQPSDRSADRSAPARKRLIRGDLLQDPKNILLFDEGGGQLFQWRGPGVYEAHSFYIVRGKDALVLGREAIRRMFKEYGCREDLASHACRKQAGTMVQSPAWFQVSRHDGDALRPGYGSGVVELFEMKGFTCRMPQQRSSRPTRRSMARRQGAEEGGQDRGQVSGEDDCCQQRAGAVELPAERRQARSLCRRRHARGQRPAGTADGPRPCCGGRRLGPARRRSGRRRSCRRTRRAGPDRLT